MICFLQDLLKHLFRFVKVIAFKDLIERNSYNLKDKPKGKLCLIYPLWYLLQVFCALIDLFYISELLNFLIKLSAHQKRVLTATETIFISNNKHIYINLQKVRIIENAWIANCGKRFTKSKQLGVCVFNTVHFSRKITTSEQDLLWLAHECVHIMQFKQRGVIYIAEALIAQRYSGYNYGKDWRNYALKAFNPEQQAEILSKEKLSFNKVEL